MLAQLHEPQRVLICVRLDDRVEHACGCSRVFGRLSEPTCPRSSRPRSRAGLARPILRVSLASGPRHALRAFCPPARRSSAPLSESYRFRPLRSEGGGSLGGLVEPSLHREPALSAGPIMLGRACRSLVVSRQVGHADPNITAQFNAHLISHSSSTPQRRRSPSRPKSHAHGSAHWSERSGNHHPAPRAGSRRPDPPASHAGGHWFNPSTAHAASRPSASGRLRERGEGASPLRAARSGSGSAPRSRRSSGGRRCWPSRRGRAP